MKDLRQFFHSDGFGQSAADTDPAAVIFTERRQRFQLCHLCEKGVMPQHFICIQRKMCGIQADIIFCQDLDPFCAAAGDPAQSAAPADPVMDKEKIRFKIGGDGHGCFRGIYGKNGFPDLIVSLKLQSVIGRIMGETIQFKQFIKISCEFFQCGHGVAPFVTVFSVLI